MNTPRMTEQELAEHMRRVRISRTKTGWLPNANGRVRSGAEGRTSNRNRGLGRAPVVAIAERLGQPVSSPASSPSFAPFQLSLTGQLPSGKNQVQLLWRNGKVHKYPNKTFTNWRIRSHIEIEEQQLPSVRVPTITQPVSLTCHYWPGDARTRDVSGQLDAIFHFLVYAKVLKDDGLIYDVTWRRHELNRKCPKVIMEVSPWNM